LDFVYLGYSIIETHWLGFAGYRLYTHFQPLPRFLTYHQLVFSPVAFDVRWYEPKSKHRELNGLPYATFLSVNREFKLCFQVL
jgi:hypothetical protein